MGIVNNIVHFLFPERPTAALVREASEAMMRVSYLPQTHHDCISLSAYRDPLVSAAIQEIKFHNNERAAKLLALLLTTWAETAINIPTFVVPMPLHASRLRRRGYNQVSRVLAYTIRTNSSLTMREDILRRTRNTAPQTRLQKEDRLKNMRKVFAVRDSAAAQLNNAHILLVDDVYTTGATMRAAKAALMKHHPASVTCLALAH